LNGLPDDPEKREGDPRFVAPGSGGVGLATLAGYRLLPDSPCLKSGVPMERTGPRDFYGNPLNAGAVSFGVFESPGGEGGKRKR
jgi:hypothetical protein